MRINEMRTVMDKETRLAYLVKEGFNYGGDLKLSNPQSIYDFMEERYQLSYQTEEHVYAICMEANMRLIGVFHISSGTVNSSLVDIRGLMIKNLLANATNFVLIHNHPSGSTNPSSEDIRITQRLKEAGNLLNIQMMDHIIIGDTYYSLKENGLF